ncbi:MAG: nuclear transport factor 2 family protein [Planctomycetota bacterium]
MPEVIAPPFDAESAAKKVQLAEDLWNTCDADRVALAYTEDTRWRNRDQFVVGRDSVLEFLRRKWEKETEYRLRKELFAFNENRIAVRFEYEYRDLEGGWHRAHGNENWVFDASGLMWFRFASINEHPISESDLRVTPGKGRVGEDFPRPSSGIGDVETWTDACGPIPHWEQALHGEVR